VVVARDPSSKPKRTESTARQDPGASPRNGRWWYLLLLLPYLGLLYLPFYAKAEPQLWGFPFFYWYQFLWVFVTMFLIDIVHRRTG
jgi:hypothetical protein